MRDPRPIPGARTPLFDRLADPGTGFQPAARAAAPVLTEFALRDHVRDELTRLLNTRSALPAPLNGLASDTVLTYGLPDFSHLSPANETERNVLAQKIAHLVRSHEPRLHDVRVLLRTVPGNPLAVTGTILGSLRIGLVPEPVTFHLTIDTRNPEQSIALL